MKKQLMLVAMLSVGTALTTMGKLKPLAASLTPPATYKYSYTWNATASEQYLNVNGVDSIPLYTRTADGVYYNYTSTFDVIDGLSITQTFKRSNTLWESSGTSYKPNQDRIGSYNDVGNANKLYFQISNSTSIDYKLYFDTSSSGQALVIFLSYYDDIPFGRDNVGQLVILNNYLSMLLIPSYSMFEIDSQSTALAVMFDAWYLQDLGISDAYQAGLDAQTDGILTDYLGTDAQQIGWVLIGIAAILFAFKGGK